jgi:hypothetical protein
MPRIHRLNLTATKQLDKLLAIEATFQGQLSSEKAALDLAIEYSFLSGYKVWENFLEGIFISQSRFNDPVAGKRTYPFLMPKTEKHALDIIKLEKDYMDWTSPDIVIKRAEILFRNHHIVTAPITSSMQDLRDAKKVRNYIAHGGTEAKRLFDAVAQRRLGRRAKGAGDFLVSSPIGQANGPHHAVYYLDLFKSLVNAISQ